MAIASDVDDTSTGSSGNPVENEDTNMLAGSSGSNQIDCTVHHYYEKLKDFAFDMPGGWTDATISLFIDTFKLYKDDFSRPHSDELKIWQKIVKRCVERSNNHKVFTVNSVMELAGSLKSHVLRNEYRKDDETFKMLYNDVVDIIPYFPNTTCDSVSQNLRLRRRTQEVKTFAKVTEPPPKAANIDNLILKYCQELNLKNEGYCCNSNWNNISIRIMKGHGIRVDVKKHLGDMKRKVHKELKGETDPIKKRDKFYEAVGPFKSYFDLIPPRTIKIEDFDKEYSQVVPSPVNAETSTDEQTSTPDIQEEEELPQPDDGPRVYRRATLRRVRPGNSSLDSFPRIRKILGITDTPYSSESDEPDSKKRSLSKTSVKDQDVEGLTESANYSGASDETGETDAESREEVTKQAPSKKKSIAEVHSISSRTAKGKTPKSSDDEISASKNTRVLKRPAPSAPRTTKNSVVSTNPKNLRVSERSSSALVKTIQNRLFKNQAKIELSQIKVGSSAVSINGQNTKKVQKGQIGMSSRSRRVNTEPTCQAGGEKNPGNVDGDLQPEARSAAPISTSNSLERMKSKNIVTPINVKVNEQLQQEASTSASCNERYSARPENNVIQQRPVSVAQDFSRLERLEDNTLRIIEGYKEKVKESGHSVMQLLPKQHIAIPPVGVSANSNNESEFAVQPMTLMKPPAWFDSFFADYKKHEMWKMHQILKMQQELVDMENRKLNVLNKILTNLNDKKS